MKTDEQVLTEWATDEIRFKLNASTETQTKQMFEWDCRFMLEGSNRNGQMDTSFERTWDLRDELHTAMEQCGYKEHAILNYLAEFFEPRKIIRYSSIEEVNTQLRLKALEVREKKGFSLVRPLKQKRHENSRRTVPY